VFLDLRGKIVISTLQTIKPRFWAWLKFSLLQMVDVDLIVYVQAIL
jgi:hypothetical protein